MPSVSPERVPSPPSRVTQSPGFGSDYGGDITPPLIGSESARLQMLLLQQAEVCATVVEQGAGRHAIAAAIARRTDAELVLRLARSRVEDAVHSLADAALLLADAAHSLVDAANDYPELMGAQIGDQMEGGSRLVLRPSSRGKGKKKASRANDGDGEDRAHEEEELEGKGKGRAPPADEEEDGAPKNDEDEDEDMYSSDN